jgi:hypothetical protein
MFYKLVNKRAIVTNAKSVVLYDRRNLLINCGYGKNYAM